MIWSEFSYRFLFAKKEEKKCSFVESHMLTQLIRIIHGVVITVLT